jgi:DNA segregation ATPase FtsK/SpoIIIE, S-DNA-T family
MADLYTSKADELIIDQVIHYGLERPKTPKYAVLRLALAKSLRLDTPPDASFDGQPVERGSEYRLNWITGFASRVTDNDGRPQDFDDAVRALLSVYHNEDLFTDDAAYRTYLQRHVRRGLHEIRATWHRGHDFIGFFMEEVLAGLSRDTSLQEGGAPGMDAIVATLEEIGVHAVLQGTLNGPRLDRHLLRLDDLDHYDLLRRGLFKLALSLGLPEEGLFVQTTDEPKVVALDIPRRPADWQPVTAGPLPAWAGSQSRAGGLPVWIGRDVVGAEFSFDLAEAPHLLVAGTTGSGKSVALHALIASLLWTQTPEQLNLALIDPKQVELTAYEGLPGLFGNQVVQQAHDARDLLDALVDEMERRHRILKEAGLTGIGDTRTAERLGLARILLVVEELADLIVQSRDLEAPLVRLAQKARSAGIHLVLATQRPDATTLSGLLRSNIPGRIALRVQKASESRIILDETGAERLLGKGDMLVRLPSLQSAQRVHGAYLSRDDIRAAIRHFNRG